MIVLVTDFGLAGPYTGQVKAVLAQAAPGVPVIDLFADAPRGDPRASAYLLAAYAGTFPAGTVFLCVVDPGVGTERRALAVSAGPHWFVGPDNGLLELAVRRGAVAAWFEIRWRPERLSASFHGRDLFAPVAAALAAESVPGGWLVPLDPDSWPEHGWPDDLAEIVYVDGYGNAMTGLRAASLAPGLHFGVGDRRLARARTFGDRPAGTAFWYENANGLAEIAVTGGRADSVLGLGIGSPVAVLPHVP